MSTSAIKTTTIRMDESLKDQATALLESIGLSFNSYLNLSVRQLVNQRRIPFEIVAKTEVPNEETRRAMVLAEAHELGLLPDEAPAFSDIDSLMSYLDED